MFERVLSEFRSWTRERNTDQREGERLLQEADYAGAELHFSHALLEAERQKQASNKRILLRLELAEAQRRQHRSGASGGNPVKLTEAEQTIRSAIELAQRSGDRSLTVQCLNALVGVLADEKNLAAAEAVAAEAATQETGLKRRDMIAASRRLSRLGVLRQQSGQFEKAAQALTESVALHEQELGPEHIGTANRLSELAAAYHALGQHAETQRCLRRAIRVHEAECGLESPEAVADLQMLTESLEAAGDEDAAANQFERVLGLKLREVGSDLDSVAEMQVALATRYIGWRRFSRARELMLEAVGTFRRKGGPRLALGYETLGKIEEESGHYHEAIQEWMRAGKVWESIQPAYTAEFIRNLRYRAFLLELMRQHKDAGFLREKADVLDQTMRWAVAG